MADNYILAIDQGTTSTRAMVFNREGQVVGKAQKEFRQIYPKSGWVEHNPADLWNSTQKVMSLAIKEAKIEISEIAGIGITNQRETTIMWDKKTSEPIYNAIVWQCRRTADICEELKDKGHEKTIQEKTGLIADPYFSGTKIKWLLDNVPQARKKAERGEILFGTVDSWLIWKLSGGSCHLTDYTNASRTMLYNIHELKWDDELLNILEVPPEVLPEVRSSSEVYTTTKDSLFQGENIPVAGIAGDQQAAPFAQACFKEGMTKSTYGTGAFALLNTGSQPYISQKGLLTTIAWGFDDKITYALEGSIFNAGSAIQWLRDELNLIEDAADSEYFACKIEDTNGVYVVPAFTGLGAPHWNPAARGTIVGISRATTKNHIIRATLESIAFQSYDLFKAMEEDAGIDIKEVRVDGGAARNDFLLQFLSNICNNKVQRPVNTETTAAGSAYLAGLAVGFWDSLDEIKNIRRVDKTFTPDMKEENRQQSYAGWKRAIDTVINWTRI